MDEVTFFFIFLGSLFIVNELVLWKKRQARMIEHRQYNTGDQVWLRGGKIIKVLSHDGLIWTECYPGLVRALDGGGADND